MIPEHSDFEISEETANGPTINKLDNFKTLQDYKRLIDQSMSLCQLKSYEDIFNKNLAPKQDNDLLELIPLFRGLFQAAQEDDKKTPDDFDIVSLENQYQMGGINSLDFEKVEGLICHDRFSGPGSINFKEENIKDFTFGRDQMNQSLSDMRNKNQNDSEIDQKSCKSYRVPQNKSKENSFTDNTMDETAFSGAFEESSEEETDYRELDLGELDFVFQDDDIPFLKESFKEMYDLQVIEKMKDTLEMKEYLPLLKEYPDLEDFDILKYNEAERNYNGILAYKYLIIKRRINLYVDI